MVEVDLKGAGVERTRRFGGPWLGRTLLRQLELGGFLDDSLCRGREQIPRPLMAIVLGIGGGAIRPASCGWRSDFLSKARCLICWVCPRRRLERFRPRC
jgi:hypothetical protein